jgi:hypothetical protein
MVPERLAVVTYIQTVLLGSVGSFVHTQPAAWQSFSLLLL